MFFLEILYEGNLKLDKKSRLVNRDYLDYELEVDLKKFIDVVYLERFEGEK